MDMSTAMQNLNWLAIIVSAVSTFLIGGLWFSPVLFGKAWMELNGFKESDLQGGQGKIFGVSFILALVMAFNLAMFLAAPEVDFSFGLIAGFLTGFGWVAMAFGVTYLFERKPIKLFWINAGYHIVAFTVMGGILGAWK